MALRRVGARVAWLLASLLLASLLIFAATNALPGDIAQVILGTNASPGEAERLRAELGLDRPFLIRYLEWLWGAVRFDFGVSYISRPTHRPADRRAARGVGVADPLRHAGRDPRRAAGWRLRRRAPPPPRRRGRLRPVPGGARGPGLLGRYLARGPLRGATPLAPGRRIRLLLGFGGGLDPAPDPARHVAGDRAGQRHLPLRAQLGAGGAPRGLLPHRPRRRLVAIRGAVAPRAAQRRPSRC